MNAGRLSLRIDLALLNDIRDYARRHGLSITDLVVVYFRKLLLDELAEQKAKKQDVEQI